MEIIVILVLIFLGGVWYYNRKAGTLDLNKDGKVTVEDVKVAVKTAAVSARADVGKVRTAVKKPVVMAKSKKRSPAKKPKA